VQSTTAVKKNSFAEDLEAVSSIEAVPHILEVICRTTGLGFAAVARVTEDRWIACAIRDEIAFGLVPGAELKVETTICDEIRNHGEPVVIDHANEDDAYCNHPTPKMYGFQSYISVPIFTSGGRFFGTLCGIDPKPAKLNTVETRGMFKLFAELIGFQLDAHQRVKSSEEALLDERRTAQLREQFIAVLGHDLRNPLNAVTGGTTILRKMRLSEDAISVVEMIQRSAGRMAGLIENVLDFARAKLGGGFSLDRSTNDGIAELLTQIIDEARISWPDRDIRSDIRIDQPVNCDGPRIAQMFSNLLSNALSHGDPHGPVWVSALSDENSFTLSVANIGEPIPPEIIGQLFLPFSRAAVGAGQQGLGLGLYIASEIARAHEGLLEVTSTIEETRFTFTTPVAERQEP
jgi:signal transduction histidine kinase